MGRGKSVCDDGAKAKRGRPPKEKIEKIISKTGFEGQATPPWRKTVSIFKQNVTLAVTSKKETLKKAPTDAQLKKVAGKSEFKPYPVLWAKSLEGASMCTPLYTADKFTKDSEAYHFERMKLLPKLESVAPCLDEVSTSATVFNTLHNPLQPGAFGQTAEKEKLQNNVLAYSNADQPMVSSISVTSEDIHDQEKRVLDARKRLQEALKQFG